LFKKTLFLFLFLVPAFAFAADVSSDFDHDADLRTVKTFQFLDEPTGELADKRMRNALRSSFSGVGLLEAVRQPDVFIAYYAGAAQKRRIRTSGHGRPAWWGVQSAWTEDYVEGTAVVDLIDAETGDLIWRGRVKGTVSLESADERIKDGMRRLAKKYAKDRESQR
jgi:hypothetical protein